MKVSLWGGDLVDSSILLVRSSEVEIFLELLEEGAVGKPERLYKIPDSISEDVDLLFVYLSYLLDFEFTPSKYRDFFVQWEESVKDISKFRDYNENVKTPKLLFRFSYLLEVLKDFEEFRWNLLSSSPLGKLDSNLFNHRWWDCKIVVFDELEILRKRLKKEKLKPGKYKDFSDYLDGIFSAYQYLSSEEMHMRILALSSLYFAASKFSLMNGDYDKSLLLLHRCYDYAFQSISFEENFIRMSGGDLAYSSRSQCHGDITLDKTRRELVDRGIVSLSEDQTKLINRVNFCRNRSILTHSLFSINKNDAENLLNLSYSTIKSISPYADKWRRLLQLFLLKPTINKSTIFNFEESFDVFIKEIIL